MDNLWIIYGMLVGGIPTPPKNMSSFVNWDDYSQDEWENKSHVPKHQSDNGKTHYTWFFQSFQKVRPKMTLSSDVTNQSPRLAA